MNKCKWTLEPETGDMVMICKDGQEGARIPQQVAKYASEATHDVTRFRMKKLLCNVEKMLGCEVEVSECIEEAS